MEETPLEFYGRVLLIHMNKNISKILDTHTAFRRKFGLGPKDEMTQEYKDATMEVYNEIYILFNVVYIYAPEEAVSKHVSFIVPYFKSVPSGKEPIKIESIHKTLTTYFTTLVEGISISFADDVPFVVIKYDPGVTKDKICSAILGA